MKRLIITIGLGMLLFSCSESSDSNAEYEPIDPGYTNPEIVDPAYGNTTPNNN